MGRYSCYGIATLIAISLKDLDNTIKKSLWGKTINDFRLKDLYSSYPEDIYEIYQTDTAIIILIKDCFNGTDIYSLLKDFSTISPDKRQLTPEIVEEIGEIIKDKPIKEVMALAERKEYEGFQTFDLPGYLYWTQIPIEDKVIYTRATVKGIMIGCNYAKIVTEDDTEPYQFLTTLLRYRLKANPLSSTLLAFLSV
ncbi:MAG: hypothetical protein K2N48_02340 [Muribaculaceae bacterium]|nr:hypothetical protein [Muribaculaceae bacterium]